MLLSHIELIKEQWTGHTDSHIIVHPVHAPRMCGHYYHCYSLDCVVCNIIREMDNSYTLTAILNSHKITARNRKALAVVESVFFKPVKPENIRSHLDLDRYRALEEVQKSLVDAVNHHRKELGVLSIPPIDLEEGKASELRESYSSHVWSPMLVFAHILCV